MPFTRKLRLAFLAASATLTLSPLAAGAFSGGAANSNWEVMLWTNPVTVSVDTASIAPHAERFIARVLWDYAEPQITGVDAAAPFKSLVGIVVFDCTTLRFGGAGSIAYSGDGGDGDLVAQYAIDPDQAPLSTSEPGTIGRDLATYVCDHAPRSLR